MPAPGQLPGHLRADVVFDHRAAGAAADELRHLARALDDHAADRARWLARTDDDFQGHGRRSVDELTRRHAQRVAALVAALHAEASRIEDDAAAARREQAQIELARAQWRSEQRLVG